MHAMIQFAAGPQWGSMYANGGFSSATHAAAYEVNQAVLERELASVVDELRDSRQREQQLRDSKAAERERFAHDMKAMERRFQASMNVLAAENADLSLKLKAALADVDRLSRKSLTAERLEAWVENLREEDFVNAARARADEEEDMRRAREEQDAARDDDEHQRRPRGRRRSRKPPTYEVHDEVKLTSSLAMPAPKEGIYTLGGYASPRRDVPNHM